MTGITEPTPTPTLGVPVMLDRERRLRYSLATTRKIRERFGVDALTTGLEEDKIAELLWFGLKHEDPDLTIEQVEEMVDLEHLSEVMDALTTATGARAIIEQYEATTQQVPPPPAPETSKTPEEEPEPDAPSAGVGDEESGESAEQEAPQSEPSTEN